MLRRLVFVSAVCVAVVAAAPPSAPVNLSYVASDSMEPTLPKDGGVILVPANDVGTGDIVTFRSEQRERLVTHRIVGRDEQGFVTQGDANPSTDQASGNTYVREDEIVGRVLTVDGVPVVIPELGLLVQFLQGHLVVTVALLLGLLAIGPLAGNGRKVDADVLRTGDVLDVVLLGAFATVVVLVLLGGVTATQSFVVTEEGVGADRTLTVDEPTTRTLSLQGPASPFTHAVVTATGMEVIDRERTSASLDLTVQIPAQPTTGVYQTQIQAYRYPAVLPASTVRVLHGVHPVVAALVTAAGAVAPMYVAGLLLVGRRTPVRAGRNRLYRRLIKD